MISDRALAYIATGAVFVALIAFMVSTMTKEGSNMVAYNTEKEVRVVCYLPDEINRKLQAYASLEGMSKQDLTRQILVDWVNNSEDKAPSKRAAKKQPAKAAEPTE